MDVGMCILLLLSGIVAASLASQNDPMYQIEDQLFYKIQQDTPPPGEDGGPVKVKLQLYLNDIVEVDKSKNQVEVLAWQIIMWSDPRVQWPDEFNITNFYSTTERIWVPDITVYNAASQVEQLSPKMAVISNRGRYSYIPSYRFRFLCDVSEADSSSGANCTIKMGSWVYNGDIVSFDDPTPGDLYLGDYFTGSKYEVLATNVRRNVLYYACCPEPYEDINFSFTFREKGSYSFWF